MPRAWTSGILSAATLARFHATVGDPAGQSFWECLACFLTLELWAPEDEPFAIQGDNIGPLQNLSKLKGRGAQVQIAKEIAWRQAARWWLPVPVHLPSELNVLADALSGLAAPAGANHKDFPAELRDVPEVTAPDPEGLWATWAPTVAKVIKRHRFPSRPRR